MLLSLYGKFQNINPVKVDKSTIIALKRTTPSYRTRRGGIGAMMIDKRVDDVIDILQPDAFTKKRTNIFLNHRSTIY
jgi:hypothetical protein